MKKERSKIAATIENAVKIMGSYEALAARFNVSVMTVYNWCNGKSEPKASVWEEIKTIKEEK